MSVPADLTQHVGVTVAARVFVAAAGVLLALWSLSYLRRRALLVPLGSIFLSISAGLVLFAMVPHAFNAVSWAIGVHYPPVTYLIAAVVVLMMLVVHLAARLSALDVRCRQLAQEIALDRAERGRSRAAGTGDVL